MAETQNPWPQLVKLGPDGIEKLVETVFTEYGQAFKPLNCDLQHHEVTVELKSGRVVKVKI